MFYLQSHRLEIYILQGSQGPHLQKIQTIGMKDVTGNRNLDDFDFERESVII